MTGYFRPDLDQLALRIAGFDKVPDKMFAEWHEEIGVTDWVWGEDAAVDYLRTAVLALMLDQAVKDRKVLQRRNKHGVVQHLKSDLNRWIDSPEFKQKMDQISKRLKSDPIRTRH